MISGRNFTIFYVAATKLIQPLREGFSKDGKKRAPSVHTNFMEKANIILKMIEQVRMAKSVAYSED